MTFLVVLAGSVVRMTGSGMGCPDWPKCFGLLIPPTEASQVTWTSGQQYVPGRMLVAQDTLWVAQREITASSFQEERAAGDWIPYDRHDYAVFNPLHTWVEFINRLLGALTGIPALLLFGLTAWRGIRTRHWRPFVWALVHLFWLGVVAWLGKKVVDGNLIPFSITIHMLGAVAILVSLMGLMRSLASPVQFEENSWVVNVRKPWLGIAALVALLQLVLGTQVREQIDLLNHAGLMRTDWLDALPSWWKWHRSGSWLVVLTQFVWMGTLRPWKAGWKNPAVLSLGLIAAQMISGISFVWLGMPALLQPLHVLLAIGLVVTNVWTLMQVSK
jgi:heme a synthase